MNLQSSYDLSVGSERLPDIKQQVRPGRLSPAPRYTGMVIGVRPGVSAPSPIHLSHPAISVDGASACDAKMMGCL